MASVSPRKITVCWCDTVFLSQHKTGADPLNTESLSVWCCFPHSACCLQWLWVLVTPCLSCPRVYTGIRSVFSDTVTVCLSVDTHVRDCDWIMGFDRAENWSSGRSKAQSWKAAKWHYWVIVSLLYQIRALVSQPRHSVVHTIKSRLLESCPKYN